MANILEYLDWRGDLTLAQDPFNEVDNLIWAELSLYPEGNALFQQRQLCLPYQQGQTVRRAGQPGDLQDLTVKKLAVIFMGWLRSTHGDPLQKHFVSGLICHLVHLSVVMLHPMRGRRALEQS